MFYYWFFLVLNVLTIPLHMHNLMWLTREEDGYRQSLWLFSGFPKQAREYRHRTRRRRRMRWVLFPLTVAALYCTIVLIVVCYITIFP